MSITYNTTKISNHIGRFGFDFYENESKIVSAGQDCMFKIYDISNGEFEMIKSLNCEDAYTLSVQQTTNDIYLGYYESKNVIKVNDLDNIDEIIGEEVATFIGPVYQIQIGGVNSNYIAISTQENKGYLMKCLPDGTYVKKYLSDNHCGSCLFTTVDNKNEYCLSIGCDGNMQIYKFDQNSENPIFETALHVTFPMVTEKEYIMECQFNSKKQIAIGGNATLQLIERDQNNKWILTRIPEINHNRDIQICQWIEDGKYLITAGVEREVKIWDFEEKTYLGSVLCEETVCTIRYSKLHKAIFIGDCEGNLYRWNDIDLEAMAETARQQKYAQKTKSVKKVEKEESKMEVEETTKNKQSATKTTSAIDTRKERDDLNKKLRQLEDIEDEEEEQQNKRIKKQEYVEKEQKIDPKQQKKQNLDALSKLVEEKTKQKDQVIPKEKLSIETPTKELNELDINENAQPSQQKRNKKNYKIQEIIYPSSVSKQLNRSCLIWNLVGQILLREEDKDLFLDFDFNDKEMHSKITLKNLHNYSIAAMNKQGFIIASKAISSSQEYEREEDFERFEFHQDAYDYSFVYFQSLVKSYKATWSLKLLKDENAETVAIGDGWCAVQTDFQYIRIYGFSSMEQHCFCIDKPVVCISGYKNLLAIVYLEGEPICGCQSLKLKFFDANTGEVLKECGVPITPFTTLSWFGFSEEGLVLTKDSKGIIRALVGYNTWTPIYEQPSNKNFWLKGMVDYQMVGFLLPKDENEPRLTQVQNEKIIEMGLPLPSGDFFENIEEYKVMRHKQLILKHEQFRYQFIEQNQKMEESIQKVQKEIDTKVLKIFQKCLAQAEYQRGFQVVKSNIINSTYIDACILIAQKAKQTHLEQQLQQLQIDKSSKSEFVNSVITPALKSTTKNLIIVSKADPINQKQRNTNLLVEKNQSETIDSSDEEENEKQNQGQENAKQNLNNHQNNQNKTPVKSGETVQNNEKKVIANNPFQKQAKKSSTVEDGLFSTNANNNSNNKNKKEEHSLQNKSKEKKLKF